MTAAIHPGVVVRGVTHAFPDVPVLDEVSFDVRPGEVVGLTGPNGAGKTTTFRIVAGLLRPAAGGVWVGGHDVLASPQAARQVCAYVPDLPPVYDHLSAAENLNLFGMLWEVPTRVIAARSESLLREVGLWNVRDRLAGGYSRGMRQKLSLCAALIHDPSVLLLDEPFSGLDTDSGLWLRSFVRQTAQEGRAVMLSTHTPEVLEATTDRVLAVRDGGIVPVGPEAHARSAS